MPRGHSPFCPPLSGRVLVPILLATGTSLICLATEDGVFLAADDLVYAEREGQAIPLQRDFRKVGAINTTLIGTAGLMVHHDIKYDFNDLIPELEKGLGATDRLPSSVADQILRKLRDVFKPAEPLVAQGVWKGYKPGDRLVNYVVAGYTKNFKRPYIFEVGVEINRSNDGLTFVEPIHHQKPLPRRVWFGEDHYFERAEAGLEPEYAVWKSSTDANYPDVVHAFPNSAQRLQEAVACEVGCIKVEAHFNPQKVGAKVNVVLVDRNSRSVLSAAF
jgi:hypothetical protein